MEKEIKRLLEEEKPKIPNLSEKESMLYKSGLGVFGAIVTDNFFDIPKLPNDRFSKEGLFYTIPYYDDEMLWSAGNKRDLLVVWEVKNRSSFCPLRIDFDIVDRNNYSITVYDQSGERTISRKLIECIDSKYYSEIEGYDTLRLSQLMA